MNPTLQRGSLLLYVLFIIAVISTLTLPLLTLTSSRDLISAQDKHRQMAAQLAISLVENYLDYLARCPSNDEKEEYFKRYLPSDLSDSAKNRTIYRLFLPDQTPITYSMYYEGTDLKNLNVVTKVVAGDTNWNNEQDEELSEEKSIIYRIDASSSDRVPLAPDTDTIIVGGSITNQRNLPNEIRVTNDPHIREWIQNALAAETGAIEQQIDEMAQRAISCSNCSLEQIQRMIADNPSPVIIRASSLTLNNNQTVQFGNAGKRVTLILDNLIINNKVDINLYGDLIVNNMNANNEFTYNRDITVPDSKLWITNTAIFSNDTELHADSIYSKGTITFNNKGKIYSHNLIVQQQLMINNDFDALIDEDLLAGYIYANNRADFQCRTGDLLVANNVTLNNHIVIDTGGYVAVGGNMVINNKVEIDVGGGSTSIGGTGGPGSGSVDYHPIRQ